jgi:hypothetical protein
MSTSTPRAPPAPRRTETYQQLSAISGTLAREPGRELIATHAEDARCPFHAKATLSTDHLRLQAREWVSLDTACMRANSREGSVRQRTLQQAVVSRLARVDHSLAFGSCMSGREGSHYAIGPSRPARLASSKAVLGQPP